MAAEDREAGPSGAGVVKAERAMLEDWRRRLQASQEQERAARTEAHQLARELALTRRLLGFFLGGAAPSRPAARPAADEIPRLRAILLTERVLFSLDSCQNHGAHTAISGWAFRPAPEWDSRLAKITLLFRHDGATYAANAPTGRVRRLDVAAHFTSQPPEITGGARNLDGAGFTCEILNDSLPERTDWEIVLRLECGSLVCEQSTGQHLRL